MSSDLTTIDFYGASLIIQRGPTPETTLVAMRPVVEGMSLNWATQYRKITSHPVLSKGVVEMTTPSNGGSQQMVAMPLPRLNFWLATIQPKKVPDEATRKAVIQYQEECADALFAHFFGKAQANKEEPTKRRLDGDAREARLQFKLGLSIAKMIGIDGNQRILSASRIAKAATGFDYLASMGVQSLDAPQQEALLTPTAIGQRLGNVSAREVNSLFCARDAQTAHRDPKGSIYYEPTAKGIQWGAVMQDTGKRHGDGTPIRQLKWASSAVDRLREEVLGGSH
ncbi:hypothetical protein GCM10019059_32090 [Camelimonas fluminis]|uniref:Phage antirepressor N-terminal domain-containing protein n=1 Tax=Camelimonas fluminis TaxID=1576911 RepID=A0ABV7UI74_9HYPH|nr:phage antirepressor N-terminal domain-containing protein [Camelimonas fluminis]GHE69926.1 hypothetical protein GCM10019059_32090 [Camelimonas fluminis]